VIISVASGKGGTGKTLVATNLALSLNDVGKVQLLDCDVEEPNAHIFLEQVSTRREVVSIPVPVVDEDRCTYCGLCADVCAYNAIAVIKGHVLVFPELCHGCGACSYLCPEKAISEQKKEIGAVESGQLGDMSFVQGKLNVGQSMATPVIRKVKEKIEPDAMSIIDVSPGTSCPVVESIKDSDFCILVTEPTPFGLNDLVLAVETVRKLDIPCGVVINRVGIGDERVLMYCQENDIPVLLEIPLDTTIARLYSEGLPLVAYVSSWREEFVGLFGQIQERLHERSRSPKR
jgi:MinD superfamily P-loop ATPase